MKVKPLLKSRDILPVCFLSSVVMHIITATFLCLMFFDQKKLVSEAEGKVFVEKQDGQIFVATDRKLVKPSSQAIKFFVKDWLKEQYSFSGKTFDPEGKVIADNGITIRYKNEAFIVPSDIYRASFAVDSEDRNKFLYLLSQEWLSLDSFNLKNFTIDFEIKEMGEPKIHDEKEKIWFVDVVAQLSYNGGAQVRRFNRRILVEPVEVPLKPESATASLFEQLTYLWRSRGFTVVGITRY